MNYRKLTALIGTALVSVIGMGSSVAIAQTPPAQTFQTGPWQPIARIDPNRQVDIRLVNESGLTVEYAFSANQGVSQMLSVGTTATLIDVVVPTFVLINAANPDDTLWYDIRVDEGANTIDVRIQRIEVAFGGYTTLNVHETGGIYAY